MGFLEMRQITLTLTTKFDATWFCDILHGLPFGLPAECFAVEMAFLSPAFLILVGWLLSVFVCIVVVGLGYAAIDPIGDGSDGLPSFCCSRCPTPRCLLRIFLPPREEQRVALLEEDSRRRRSSLQAFPS